MNNSLGWLHLSDLHFLEKKDWKNSPVLEKLLKDIRKLYSDGRRIDIIFCTGDIGFGETSKEPLAKQYATAKTFFDHVLEICQLPITRLFLVPGNHDIDRTKVAESQTEYFRSPKRNCDDINHIFNEGNIDVMKAMERLAQYQTFVRENYQHIILDDKANFGATIDVNGLRLSISGFNSAWTCAGDGDKDNIWLAGEAQMAACTRAVAITADSRIPDLRIALIHHPLEWFHPSESNTLKGLIGGNFDFLLHGHEHDQWVKETAAPHHIVISAGAATADTNPEFGYSLAQFSPGTANIHLRTYSAKGAGGWIPLIIPDLTESGVWQLQKPPHCFKNSKLATMQAISTMQLPPSIVAEHAPVTLASPHMQSPTGAASRGYFGLDNILEKCSRQLKKNPLMALCGLTGVGKTVIIKELQQLPTWQNLRRYNHVALERGSPDDLFGALATLLDIHDERPALPIAANANEMTTKLQAMTSQTPAFFLHIERGHLWFHKGKWLQEFSKISILLTALMKAYPGSVIVLETREALEDIPTIAAIGLPKSAMKEYLAHPPSMFGTGWELTAQERDYIFQRMGGGGGQGAHAFGLTLLAQLAKEKKTTPEQILRQYSDDYALELYAKLFRDIYENVLDRPERELLYACSLYRTGLHYSHLSRLETILQSPSAGAALMRRRLLTEEFEWLHLHDLATEQAKKLAPDMARTLALQEHIANFWLTDLGGQNTLLEPNIRRALEALYHLEQSGKGHRITEIAAELLGRRPGEAVSMLWRIEEKYNQQNNQKNVCLVLEYLLKVKPDDHKAMRFLGEYRRKLYGQTDARALELFREAVRYDPGFPHYWANYGHAAIACGAETRKQFLIAIESAAPALIDDKVAAIYATALQADGRSMEASALRKERIDAYSANAAFYADEALWLLNHRSDNQGALAILEMVRQRGFANDVTESIYAWTLDAAERAERVNDFETPCSNSQRNNAQCSEGNN